MTSVVFRNDGYVITQSHNLRAILAHAKGRGVDSIRVYCLNDGGRRPGAFVRVFYRGGDVGETYFPFTSHALDWAEHYAGMSPRVSWFAGARVDVETVAPGVWTYPALRPGLPGESWPVSYAGRRSRALAA